MKTMTNWMIGLTLAASLMTAAAQDNSTPNPASAGPRGPGRGFGLRMLNGTGPRAQMGICPLVTNAPEAAVTTAPGGRGPGFGMGYGCGCCQGRGFGWRNGTGPRAQAGLCPLVNSGPAADQMAAPGGGRGRGPGGGWGRGGGWGLRNGTGPRAQAGTCPLEDSPAK